MKAWIEKNTSQKKYGGNTIGEESEHTRVHSLIIVMSSSFSFDLIVDLMFFSLNYVVVSMLRKYFLN